MLAPIILQINTTPSIPLEENTPLIKGVALTINKLYNKDFLNVINLLSK